MNKRTRSLPIMVVVAVVALVLGSFGTASAAGLTKSQVKKIATKVATTVVNKKASSLSVAHAVSADTATNSTNLAGQSSGTYLDRGAASAGTGIPSVAVPANTPTEVGAPVTLTLPAGVNAVAVSASLDYTATATQTASWYAVDTTCATLSGFGYDHRMQGGTAPTGVGTSLNVLQPLTAGSTHTFRLCAYSLAASTVLSPQLLVQTVALNGTGGTSFPKPAASGAQAPVAD